MKKEAVLVINPGSTSTKLALFDRDGAVFVENIDHAGTAISNMPNIQEQLPLRIEIVNRTFKKWLNDHNLVAVVGRGGLLRPLKSGIYRVNAGMMDDAISCKYAIHASNLGASIADGVAKEYDVPAFVVDPVTVDEFIPEARISGTPEVVRRSRLHALNVNACVRKESEKIGKPINESNFVVAHLGGGITIAAIDHGKIIDCNDALMGMGPFSPERAGSMPLEQLLHLAVSGKYTMKELYTKFTKKAGLKAYLGTNDVREVLARIEKGDDYARLVFSAMIYQISKEIGAYATVLKGKVDRIIITGGLARSEKIIEMIRDRVNYLAEISVYPGENELEAMAAGGFRAVDGTQEIHTYEQEK
ncbi:MAG: butyrate kinase [Candidatus Marinimicrobia bacterium]|nr:butyrate kinase [Candidatus Neomarinimicrobiota bacterium]